MRQLGLAGTLLLLIYLLPLAPPRVLALEATIPREHHAWGQFNEGSWKRVRVVSETTDKQGRVVDYTTTETTTTLVDVTDHGYAVRVESMVETGGRRFQTPSQVIRRGFCGEIQGTPASARRIGTESIKIGTRTIPSEVRHIVIHDGPWRQVLRIHYSDSISPYVLRRESTVTDQTGRNADSKIEVKAIAVDVPYQVLSELKQTSRVKTVHETNQGKTETVEVHCPEVPGNVVYHKSQEFDSQDRLVRTNTLQLIAYGTVDHDRNSQRVKPTRRGLLGRRHR